MKKSYYIQPMVYLVETSNFCSIHDPSGASDPSVGANQALFFDEEEEKAIRNFNSSHLDDHLSRLWDD